MRSQMGLLPSLCLVDVWGGALGLLNKHPAPSTDDVPPTSSTVEAPVRSLTRANRSLRFLDTGAPGSPHVHTVSLRAAVPGMCIASEDLLSYIANGPVDTS